jgi:hypothetical protein
LPVRILRVLVGLHDTKHHCQSISELVAVVLSLKSAAVMPTNSGPIGLVEGG